MLICKENPLGPPGKCVFLRHFHADADSMRRRAPWSGTLSAAPACQNFILPSCRRFSDLPKGLKSGLIENERHPSWVSFVAIFLPGIPPFSTNRTACGGERPGQGHSPPHTERKEMKNEKREGYQRSFLEDVCIITRKSKNNL